MALPLSSARPNTRPPEVFPSFIMLAFLINQLVK
jgi:hypothetical protein